MAGGTPAGIAALLIGLQPILTVVIARGWFGERVVPRQGLGFALGLGGVWLVRFTPEFIFALGRSVIVLSVGAISLFYWLLRHGAAANIARRFFLVPASTAVMAALMFGETISRTLASVHSPAGECTSLVECSVPPNHTVNRTRRLMASTWRVSARRAGYLSR